MSGEAERTSFRDLFGMGEFRALWLAQLLSVAGDQVARVALTLLVYDRTRSAALAAVTFVMGMLPAFVGGILLSGLGDRLPRRTVMVGCDLARAALVIIMIIPGLPLAALVALLFAVSAGSAPFTAARSALYPEILSGGRYMAATAITLTTSQFAQVTGFAAGGAIAGFFGVRTALLTDAATFAVSALLIARGVTNRPAPPPGTLRRAGVLASPAAAIRLVLTSPALRTPMLLAWLAAFYNAPEGVATPFAHQLHGGGATAGLLLAAPALGYSLTALLFSKLAPAPRQQLMLPLATVCCALLIPLAVHPPLAVTLPILAASGGCACFQVAANAAFVAAAPAQQRSQATGLAIAGLSLGQGLAMIAAGAAADFFAPSVVIAAAGAAGTAAAGMLGLSARSRAQPRRSTAEPR